MDYGNEIRSKTSSDALKSPVGFWTSLGRSQLASLLATLVDFTTLVTLVEGFHIWYVVGRATGALLGAVTNFLVNRHWSFQVSDRHVRPQAIKYAFVSLSSLGLNTLGTFLVTEYGHLPYWLSALLVSLAVGLGFNFPLHRNFVFR